MKTEQKLPLFHKKTCIIAVSDVTYELEHFNRQSLNKRNFHYCRVKENSEKIRPSLPTQSQGKTQTSKKIHFRNRFHGRRGKAETYETFPETGFRQKPEAGTVCTASFLRKKNGCKTIRGKGKAGTQNRENILRLSSEEKRETGSAADAGAGGTALGGRENKIL